MSTHIKRCASGIQNFFYNGPFIRRYAKAMQNSVRQFNQQDFNVSLSGLVQIVPTFANVAINWTR